MGTSRDLRRQSRSNGVSCLSARPSDISTLLVGISPFCNLPLARRRRGGFELGASYAVLQRSQRFRCRNGLARGIEGRAHILLTLLDGLSVLMPAMVKNDPLSGSLDETRAGAAACAVHGRIYKRLTEDLVDDGNRSEPMTLHE